MKRRSYFRELTGAWPESLDELIGGPWFSWPRVFTDFCGNPYGYEVHDTGMGRREYRLQAPGCDGIPGTDPLENLFFFSADSQGNFTAPDRRFVFLPSEVFD